MTHQLGVALVGEELDHGGLRANMCMCVCVSFSGKGPKQVVSLCSYMLRTYRLAMDGFLVAGSAPLTAASTAPPRMRIC